MTANAEHQDKLDRLAGVARAAGADAVLLAAHHNIAWLTGGRHNRIDTTRETGTARLLLSPIRSSASYARRSWRPASAACSSRSSTGPE